MQTDPIGYADGMNWYNYVGSDPINGSDPSGNGDEPTQVTVVGQRCASGATCLKGNAAQDWLWQMQNQVQNITDGLGKMAQAFSNWNTPSNPGQCAANEASGAAIGAVAGGIGAGGADGVAAFATGGVALAAAPGAITAGVNGGAVLGAGTANVMSASCHNGGTNSAMSSNGNSGGGQSTGRSQPSTLKEKMKLEEIKANPTLGQRITRIVMGDARWPASDGCVKMEYKSDGVDIHYTMNTRTGSTGDFKFK